MRIGLLLRGVDKKGGTGIYARNLVPQLLKFGTDHEWVLLYQSPDQTGHFDLPVNATEVVLPARNNIWWDQVVVPKYARKEKLQVLFNTKFTLPLRRSVGHQLMALHGASWYVIPQCYPWWDVQYIKLVMPLYCRAATHLVSNSQCTTRDYIEIVGVPAEKITTVPLAPAPHFRRVEDQVELDRVRSDYDLPEKFVLSVVAYDPRKNVPRLLESFLRMQNSAREKIELVLVGSDCHRFREDLPELSENLGSRLRIPGWIEQEDLPVVYSLATLFFFPSLYEEFGIPNCEAMACGTPIVTANTGAPPDIVGDAGVFVDPTDVEAMAETLGNVLENPDLRATLSKKGMERSSRYSWERTGRETLKALEGST